MQCPPAQCVSPVHDGVHVKSRVQRPRPLLSTSHTAPSAQAISGLSSGQFNSKQAALPVGSNGSSKHFIPEGQFSLHCVDGISSTSKYVVSPSSSHAVVKKSTDNAATKRGPSARRRKNMRNCCVFMRLVLMLGPRSRSARRSE